MSASLSPTPLRNVPTVLGPLVTYLDRLEDRAPLERISALLAESAVGREDLGDHVRFDPRGYRRNLVAEGPWYSLLVLCWRSGQRSPIHDHAGSACAFKVLDGICSETAYLFSPCGQVFPSRTTDYAAGAIVATQDEETHQVSNLQLDGRDLVTLHLYTPPLRTMHRFSILGEERQPWTEPDIVDGAAI